ncbi:hypothetical protein [Pantoea sp. BAV 3049]|uniref:hypothetical protein n=1 Tax=Pantoea sp. BAV 3049 TaxID=2654188 RepID=UPI00131A95B7|nr:hypothetical protein [Pantoea sp. BAV 3049]
MKNFINVEKLETIADCLAALAQITADIEDIRLQLDFPRGDDPEWQQRASFAFRKCKAIKMNISTKLAVLRQQEKEQNRIVNVQHNDLLIAEMRRYLPRSAFAACVHRAKMKQEAACETTD